MSERLGRAIPGARVEPIEGAGHAIPWERPDEVSRLLVTFAAAQLAQVAMRPS